MKNSRREFLKQASVAGLVASIVGPLSACSNSDSKPKPNTKSDPTVSKYTGPHGEGLPITMVGYEYNRVKALIDGSVKIEGCSTTFESTSIGPLNNHAFFGPPYERN